MTPSSKNKSTLSRREALKSLLAISGVTTFSRLPLEWTPPHIEVGYLPAHAQASSIDVGSEIAVMATSSQGRKVVVFPTAATNLPTPIQYTVPDIPGIVNPHGVAYFDDTGALVSDFNNALILVVDLLTVSLTGIINIFPHIAGGTGTIAVSPDSTYALANGSFRNLIVIPAPFTSSSSFTIVPLPAEIASYQTQGIVFNTSGRAFVYHREGISVLDPPYTYVTFTIPVSFNDRSGAIAISPDGNKLLCVDWVTSNIYIFTAPFSAGSTPETLTITSPKLDTSTLLPIENSPDGPFKTTASASKAVGFAGINITPDGSKALVCSSTVSTPKVYAISAPFTSISTIEEIPLPVELTSSRGFEDIGINSEGQLAIITGGNGSGSSTGLPAAFIQAPFTAAGATVHVVDIVGGGRGAGAVRFKRPKV